MIRGPGIQPGTTVAQMGLNIDIAPTIAALGGTVPPPEAQVDGRSLLPLLFPDETGSTQQAQDTWRQSFLFEFYSGEVPVCSERVMGFHLFSLFDLSTCLFTSISTSWYFLILFILFWHYVGLPKGGKVARGPYCHSIIMAPNNTYHGVRTATGLKYVEVEEDVLFTEFYNLSADPWEAVNSVNASAHAAAVEQLQRLLNKLKNCSEAGCWTGN